MRLKPLTLISYALLSTTLLFAGVCHAHKQVCQKTDDQIDELTNGIKNMDNLYAYYQHYAACDDGYHISDSTSATTEVLIIHWDSVISPNAMINRDKGFRSFVFDHITFCEEEKDLATLEELSSSCRSRKICQDIHRRVK